MNRKALFVAPMIALLLGASGPGWAATSTNDGAAGIENESGMMPNRDPTKMMSHMRPDAMRNHGMMSGGMMNSDSMMGMMGSCPMMSAASGANGKVMMQMHGEMMRAMGDIMLKYADKLDVPPSPK